MTREIKPVMMFAEYEDTELILARIDCDSGRTNAVILRETRRYPDDEKLHNDDTVLAAGEKAKKLTRLLSDR